MINTSKIYRNVLLITQQGRQPSLRWMTIFLEFKKGPVKDAMVVIICSSIFVITLRIYFVSILLVQYISSTNF